MTVTIYHNPRCSKSRQTLALIREQDVEPVVVEYLRTPPTRAVLLSLMERAKLAPRDLIRTGEALYKELDLAAPGRSDEDLLDAMVEHPILINRPLVETDEGVRLCRPPELVREMLPPRDPEAA